ncbi:hypothetical protein ALC53_04382 [Atta colombica]|uniref:Uncharacterized protein n=1 Tax=Atta colombica TaxID=520822 RepID=A0A195BKE7_9HYME|nr:hypothetical protein ALC53_04382 [Atta colombica]
MQVILEERCARLERAVRTGSATSACGALPDGQITNFERKYRNTSSEESHDEPSEKAKKVTKKKLLQRKKKCPKKNNNNRNLFKNSFLKSDKDNIIHNNTKLMMIFSLHLFYIDLILMPTRKSDEAILIGKLAKIFSNSLARIINYSDSRSVKLKLQDTNIYNYSN